MTPVALVRCTPFGPIQRAIATLLAEHCGEWISTETLISVGYALDPNGGPEDAENSIKAHIHLIRRRLAPLGLQIEGRSYSGRRMVRKLELQGAA